MRAPSRGLARFVACLSILAPVLLAAPSHAQAPSGSEKRIALVVGNADYKAGALATPANDAGLVAQTLQAAGFDVVGARDLDEDSLRKAMRDFTDKAAASGPDTVAFVYLAGYGLQLAGENYFAPVDAEIGAAADVPVQSLRVSDYKRRLASIPLKARFLVLDAARENPFAKTGDPLAGGLALTEADPGSLIAFNAAPGTVGPEEKGPYGAYAQALVEMIRDGGLAPDQLFDRVRLRVSETTQGAEVPWNAGRLEPGFVFFQRAADAPKLAEPETVSALESRPLKDLGPKEAYSAALKRDSIQGYQDFADAYPREPVTKRVRALTAARRESLTWRRTYEADTPDGYWTYLSRYPRGPHAYDCRRRLRELSAAMEPPPSYAALDYDIPPPPPDEIVYVERPVVYFADPIYDLPPPPPPPIVYLAPRPAYIVDLAPPPPVYDYYALPVPAFAPLPVYVAAPAYIAPPVNNVYFTNIHNTVVINEINRRNVAYSEQRRTNPALAIGAGAVAGAALGAAAARVALPPTVQRRAAEFGPPPAGARNPQLDLRRAGLPDRGNRLGNADMPGFGQGRAQDRGQGRGQDLGSAVRDRALPGQQNGRPLPQQDGRPGMANRPDDRNGLRMGDRLGDRPGDRPGQAAGRSDPRDDTLRPGLGERRPGLADPRRVDPRQADPRQAGRPDPKLDARDKDRPQQAGRPDNPALANRRDERPGAVDRQPDGRPLTPAQQRLQAVQERKEQAKAAQAEKREALQQRLQGAPPGAPRGDPSAVQRQQQLQADRLERQQGAQREQRQMQLDRLEKQQAVQAASRQREAAQEQRLQAMQQRAAAQQQAAQAQQRQQMMQQQAQAQAQRQQMIQQQQAQRQQMMMQRQQAMSRPQSTERPQPRGGGGRGCPPGLPCR